MSKVLKIDTALIDPDPNQPRKTFPEDHIRDLAASIKKRGQKQPAKVRAHPQKKGRYIITMGECRWRACKLIGRELEAIVENIDEGTARVDSIIENLQRLDMNPIEEAAAYRDLRERYGYTVSQIAHELGKGAERVQNRLNLLELDDNLQTLVARGSITASMGSAISWAPKAHHARILKRISAGDLKTVEQVRHACIALRDAAAQVDAFADAPAPARADIEALTRLEKHIEDMTWTLREGFKDGECIAAQRVSPQRVTAMADKLALIRKHMLNMEHDLRRVATQTQIKMEIAA